MLLEEQTIESTTTPQADREPQPSELLMRLLFGKHVTYCVSAVARFGIADLIADDEFSVEVLAAEAKIQPDALYRTMRVLSGVGVFIETNPRTFSLGPLGQLLRSDVPGSLRFPAIQMGEPWSARAWEYFPEAVRNGQDAITLAYGMNIFEYTRKHPAEAEVFNRSMSQYSAMSAKAILDAYDFMGIQCMADVGGGHGFLLASVLRQYPQMQGVVYDTAEVVAGALAQPHFEGLRGRATVEGGSFFERVPAGCDAYIMKSIIHDWSDEHCLRILNAIRPHLSDGGRVLVCELLIEDGAELSFAKLLDIEMLSITVGGRERTVEQFRRLFAQAGLRLTRVVRTASPVCVLEAVLA